MSTSLVKLQEQDLAVATRESDDLTNVQRLGKMLAASGYFSDVRDIAQAAVKVLAGRELGIPPIASMMGISVIKGKVALGGNLIASRIRAHGYDYRVKKLDAVGCVLQFLGKLEGGKREPLGESSFLEADAKNAEIKGDMYKKYPRNMYFNRAISNGAKWYCPEVLCGLPVYSPEELGAATDEHGDAISDGEVARRFADIEPDLERQDLPQAVAADPEHPDITTPHPLAAWENEFRLAPKFEKLRLFQLAKERFVKVLGGKEKGEARYYFHLGQSGVEKSDQFANAADGLRCFREMVRELMALDGATAAFAGEPVDA